MKLVFVLCALIGMTVAAPDTFSLQSDLQEIVSLIPLKDIRAVARRYLDTDAEFQRVVAYLQGSEWGALVGAVRENPSWQKFKKYLSDAGIDVEGLIAAIHDLITGATPAGKSVGARGIREFIDEVKALVPKDEIKAVIQDKMQNSPDFQALYAKLAGPESRKLFDEVRSLEEVQRIAAVLRGMGVDLDKVLNVIYAFLGWN